MEEKKILEMAKKIYENMTDDQKKRAVECNTAEDFMAIVENEGVEIPDEMFDDVAGGVAFNANTLNSAMTNTSTINSSTLNQSTLNSNNLNAAAFNSNTLNTAGINQSVLNTNTLNASALNTNTLNASKFGSALLSSLNLHK